MKLEKSNFRFFGSRGGLNSPLMHVPFGFNQNIEIESQPFELRNLNARGTNSGQKTKFKRLDAETL